MVETDTHEVTNLQDLKKEIAFLTARLADLEARNAQPAPPAPAAVPASAPAAPDPEPEDITQEELLAISAALAAYLGVRVHIRHIRLISSPAWAQQGRVFIQASHRLKK